MSLLKTTIDFLQSFVDNKDLKDELFNEQLIGASPSELRKIDPEYNTRYLNSFKAKSDMVQTKDTELKTCPQCKGKGSIKIEGKKETCPYCKGVGKIEILTL